MLNATVTPLVLHCECILSFRMCVQKLTLISRHEWGEFRVRILNLVPMPHKKYLPNPTFSVRINFNPHPRITARCVLPLYLYYFMCKNLFQKNS